MKEVWVKTGQGRIHARKWLPHPCALFFYSMYICPAHSRADGWKQYCGKGFMKKCGKAFRRCASLKLDALDSQCFVYLCTTLVQAV